jgi:hypothetical protein
MAHNKEVTAIPCSLHLTPNTPQLRPLSRARTDMRTGGTEETEGAVRTGGRSGDPLKGRQEKRKGASQRRTPV